MAKISRPVLYTLLLGVVAYAFVVLSEPDAPAPKAKTTRRSVASKTPDSKYLPEDSTAKFNPLAEPLRNAFEPGVPRNSGGSLSGDLVDDGTLPSAFTGGEANWVFTGTVEIDGMKQALLENRSTLEGVFVKVGERWKRTRVITISDSNVELEGPDGSIRSIRRFDPTRQAEEEGVAPMPVPVPGSLRGTIGGGGIAVTPERGGTAIIGSNTDAN